MADRPPSPFAVARPPLAVVLGSNEVASAIGARLARSRRAVVLSHDPLPPVLRRGMAFHDALWGEEVVVDGVRARAVENLLELLAVGEAGAAVAITRMGLVDLMPLGRFDLLVDARLHKYAVTPDLRPFADATIGLGPGFTAAVDCDVAVETHPDRLGLLVTRGATAPPDGAPPRLGGHGEARYARAAFAGTWRTALPIGVRVYRGQRVGRLDREPVRAPMDGILRGLVRDGAEVPAAAKLVEVDPRPRREAAWTGVDPRGRILAEAVIEAVGLLADRASMRALASLPPFPSGRAR